MEKMFTVKWKLLSPVWTQEIEAESEEEAREIWLHSTFMLDALDDVREMDFEIVTVVRHSLEEKTSV